MPKLRKLLDRRRGPRRKEEVQRMQGLSRLNPRSKELSIIALICWATVATVGAAAAAISAHNDNIAINKSTKAIGKSNTSLALSGRALAEIQHNISRQHVQIEDACRRLNVQRATANIAYSSQYRISNIFFYAVRAQRQPRNQSERQKQLIRRFLEVEKSAVSGVLWTPLTDCALVVAAKGGSYRVPSPIRFSKQFPPSSQLDTKNAALPSPVGSIP